MKILLLTSHLKIGGIPVYTVTLANHLLNRGHTVFVASTGGELEKELADEIKQIKLDLRTKSVMSPRVWISALRLKRLIKSENIDMMHAQTRVTQFVASLASKLAGIPYVVTWHGFYRPHLFRKLFPCWGERTIAISRAVYRTFLEYYKRDENKVRLVLNGVDTAKFIDNYSAAEKQAIKKKYGLKDGPVVGIISRLAAEKGHRYLIEAFKGVVKRIPDAQLVIVGDGRIKQEIKDRAASLGLDRSVYFFEPALNKTEILAIMNIFARPGLEEPFGLNLVEAMLMGVPAVSTDVGDFEFIVKEAECGILVKKEDPAGLEEAIVRILADPTLAQRMGKVAREYAISHFSAERMTEEIERVYKEVIGERR